MLKRCPIIRQGASLLHAEYKNGLHLTLTFNAHLKNENTFADGTKCSGLQYKAHLLLNLNTAVVFI